MCRISWWRNDAGMLAPFLLTCRSAVTSPGKVAPGSNSSLHGMREIRTALLGCLARGRDLAGATGEAMVGPANSIVAGTFAATKSPDNACSTPTTIGEWGLHLFDHRR